MIFRFMLESYTELSQIVFAALSVETLRFEHYTTSPFSPLQDIENISSLGLEY